MVQRSIKSSNRGRALVKQNFTRARSQAPKIPNSPIPKVAGRGAHSILKNIGQWVDRRSINAHFIVHVGAG